MRLRYRFIDIKTYVKLKNDHVEPVDDHWLHPAKEKSFSENPIER